jgi:hypothetical protein
MQPRRRLKKLATKEEEEPPVYDSLGNAADACIVCRDKLSHLISIGKLECGHSQFCFDCILTWGRASSNRCPVCNARFYKISQYREGKIWDVTVNDTNLENDHIDEIAAALEARWAICGSDEDEEHMLLCDGWDTGYHTVCLELLDVPPCETWFCSQCLPE